MPFKTSRWLEMRPAVALVAFFLSAYASLATAAEFELAGAVAAEGRTFFESAQFPGQHGANGSAVIRPEFYYEWADGAQSVLFTPFLRVDQGDARRSHADIRELAWVHAAERWEIRAGIRRVFWGVAESNHLVDVINQTDLVENIDTEDKLGQPMLNLALIRAWGTMDFFVLPGFRERTFPGRAGRLRTGPRVDTSSATYESAAENKHVDYAARYSHVFGEVDLGLYHFWGTSREPRFDLRRTPGGEAVLAPRYDLIHQTGLDAQWTHDNWLWKLETIRRAGQGDTFVALVGGFEYTFVGAFGTPLDLGLLSEYHFDDRGRAAPTTFNDDLMTGTRLSLNDVADSTVLLGYVRDLHGAANFLNVEASRRLGERWKLELELRLFWDIARRDPLHALVRDDYLQLELARYF